MILFTAVNGPLNSLKDLASRAQCPPAPRQVAAARSMAEWVLIPALCRPDSAQLWAELEVDRPAYGYSDYRWQINLLKGEGELPEGQRQVQHSTKAEAPIPENLAAQYAWQYPHQQAVNVHSKLTATQLKGRGKDLEAMEEGVELRPALPEVSLRTPCFTDKRPLTAAQRGTALHMVMQYLNFDCTGSCEEIQAEIDRLTARQFITPQQGAAVEPQVILDFFRSELGQRMLRAKRLEREFKFSLLVPAADYYPEAAGLEDEVLLQGVVDCWFEEEDGSITVVDFKTDRVSEHTVQTRAEEYRGQLEAYTRALGQVMGVTVGRRLLWFFAVGSAVEVS